MRRLTRSLEEKLIAAYADPNREVAPTRGWKSHVALVERGLAAHRELDSRVLDGRGHLVRSHGYVLTAEGVETARGLVEEREAAQAAVEAAASAVAESVPARDVVVADTTYTTCLGADWATAQRRPLAAHVTPVEVRRMLRVGATQGLVVRYGSEPGVIRLGDTSWLVPNRVGADVEAVGPVLDAVHAVRFGGGGGAAAGTVQHVVSGPFPEWRVRTAAGVRVEVRPKASLAEAVTSLGRACGHTCMVVMTVRERGYAAAQDAQEKPGGVAAAVDAAGPVNGAQNGAGGFTLLGVGPLSAAAAQTAARRVVDSAAPGYELVVMSAGRPVGDAVAMDADGALKTVREAAGQEGREIWHDNEGTVLLVSAAGACMMLRPVRGEGAWRVLGAADTARGWETAESIAEGAVDTGAGSYRWVTSWDGGKRVSEKDLEVDRALSLVMVLTANGRYLVEGDGRGGVRLTRGKMCQTLRPVRA